ncbi:MAG TPA: glycosyltransferase family A protein [Mycobacteriales bacterium]|nr:glycosyltransferase family A protein [Mycobacteriales bacterium]HWC34258.1 glycosyltransferase family A protein [Mycobacteriales bacterium]
MTIAAPTDSAQSASWEGAAAAVAVVVSTHNRGALLDGLLGALEAQDHRDTEVVVADNGSSDDTWQLLTARCARTPMRLRALRLPFHDGPGVPRNTCIAEARAELIAFTDDDCLPTPHWLSALTAAFDAGTAIVQGRTLPEPGGWGGPWGRTLTVTSPSGLYETANLAARRAAILEVGGFAGQRLLSGRAFGEDVVLGSAIARTGGFRFAADAVVHHRVMAGNYRDFLDERRRLAGFPMLVREVPELRQRAFLRLFLSRRTASADLAVAAATAVVVADLLTLSPWPSLIGLAMLPWVAALSQDAKARPGRGRASRAAQLGWADVVGFGALLAGSIRARRLLL